jgi:hypothetical protein
MNNPFKLSSSFVILENSPKTFLFCQEAGIHGIHGIHGILDYRLACVRVLHLFWVVEIISPSVERATLNAPPKNL